MAGSKHERLRRVLRRLQADHTHVRIMRRPRGVDRIDGYVVGVGRRWVLLSYPDETYPDGWTAVRLRDIRTVRDAPGQRLTKKAFELERAWPPAPPAYLVDLDSTKGLVDSLWHGADLVGVHLERLDPDIAFFGRIQGQHHRRLWLHEIDPDGRWSKLYPYRRDRISRFLTGDRYRAMLLRGAGATPSDPQTERGLIGDR